MAADPENPPPIRLLFIDDDASYMAVARHLLSKYQGRRFLTVWKQDPRSGLEYLDGRPPLDMLVVDYYLPGMNGLELTREIRARQIDIPIIFLTSNRDFRLAIEVMKYGVEDYLIKDEAIDSVLPRSIINILERVRLKQQITTQAKTDLIARKRTDAIHELVVTVCHEFNNPLAAIKISTDILLRQNLDEEDKKMVLAIDAQIGVVEREISRLRDLNFEKIDFAKL
ncbi:MAG: response regulator [Bacteroidetes bacterium]|nr:response regulator [Bacteroidota bacterium]